MTIRITATSSICVALFAYGPLAVASPAVASPADQAGARKSGNPSEVRSKSLTTFPVSDAGSVVRDADFVMRWDAQTKGQPRSLLSEGSLQVQTRLDVSRWSGQRGRVYMRMPPVDLPGLQVRWQTRGPLLSGRVSPGQRALVFDGLIPPQQIQDLMAVTFTTDGRYLTSPRRVVFTFEIDVES